MHKLILAVLLASMLPLVVLADGTIASPPPADALAKERITLAQCRYALNGAPTSCLIEVSWVTVSGKVDRVDVLRFDNGRPNDSSDDLLDGFRAAVFRAAAKRLATEWIKTNAAKLGALPGVPADFVSRVQAVTAD